MHYLDDKQIENNILQIVLYKHEVLPSEDEIDYEITSIQKCQYVPPRLILKLLKNPNKLSKFKEIAKLEIEKWWLLSFKQNKWDKLSLLSFEDVSDDDNNAPYGYRMRRDLFKLH